LDWSAPSGYTDTPFVMRDGRVMVAGCLRLVRLAAVLLPLIVLFGSRSALAAPAVYTSDFINDANRSHFNGFEAVPATANTFFGPSWTEDHIRVEQVNGKSGPQITYSFTSTYGFNGERSWYPDGGDFGYTRIMLDDGSPFDSIDFRRGSGGGETE